MKILIADKLAPEGAAFLAGQGGVEVLTRTGLSGDELAAAIREADGVVVRSETRITGPILDQAMRNGHARLRAIARAGVGVDNIDLPAATRHGVAVMNSASASTITTAEHAFALLIGLARRIAPAHMTMAGGGWDRAKFTGVQLHGKTLGIVGLGRIGQTLAHRALAFGMNVRGFDPLINAETMLDGQVTMCRSFDDLIRQVDVVSFHVPATESTTGMLGRSQFAEARKGLLVVNAARGGVVDEQALLEALDSGQCGGAALDVFPVEPPPRDDPLRTHPNVLLTPHLGASTVEAQEAVAVDACKALLAYLRGEGFLGAVNAGGLRLDMTDRQRAFVDLASRMIALIASVMGQAPLAGATFTFRGESLAGRAETIARLALAGLLGAHLDQPVNIINAALIAEERKIDVKTVIAAEHGEDRLRIAIRTGDGAERIVEGAIYADGLPRVTNLDGYALDMIPAGPMVLLTNADQPGRIGLVGNLFGQAGINIAEMVIGRKPAAAHGSGQVAMMILKLDESPPASLLATLRAAPGILSVAAVTLPEKGV